MSEKYGTLECTSENPNESLEGSHSCIIGMIETLMELERRGAILVKGQLDIKFLDDELEESFMGFNIEDTNVIIDTISLERLRRFEELSNDSKKSAFKLLMEYEYIWMNKTEYLEFASKFLELYSNIDGVTRYDQGLDFDPESIEDINLCIESLSNKHYYIRSAGEELYQLCFYEKEII